MPDRTTTDLTEDEANSVHIRAVAILSDVLVAQGRPADSFSYSEYAIATEQALNEHNMTAPKISGMAEEVGTLAGERMFRLDGQLVNEATLLGTVERRHANADLVREVDRELGEALTGLDVHTTAMKLLASRGISNPTADQLLDAYEEVS
jgi:hypothetical protein